MGMVVDPVVVTHFRRRLIFERWVVGTTSELVTVVEIKTFTNDVVCFSLFALEGDQKRPVVYWSDYSIGGRVLPTIGQVHIPSDT